MIRYAIDRSNMNNAVENESAPDDDHINASRNTKHMNA